MTFRAQQGEACRYLSNQLQYVRVFTGLLTFYLVASCERLYFRLVQPPPKLCVAFYLGNVFPKKFGPLNINIYSWLGSILSFYGCTSHFPRWLPLVQFFSLILRPLDHIFHYVIILYAHHSWWCHTIRSLLGLLSVIAGRPAVTTCLHMFLNQISADAASSL